MYRYLNGSSETGKKIIKNWNIFKFKINSEEKTDDGKMRYQFLWSFDEYQHGYGNIVVNNAPYYIDGRSFIFTDNDSPRPFKRPLGLYNDETMREVYEAMLQSKR